MKANFLKWVMYLLLVSFVSCSSCKKKVEPSPESKLPPETQTGANTFGCLIDGVPWIPNGGGGFSLIPAISINRNQNRIILFTAYNKSDNRYDINICFDKYTIIGEKLLQFDTEKYPNVINPSNYGEYIQYQPSPQNDIYYSTNSNNGGKCIVTKYEQLTNGYILSGTFEFDAIDNQTGKIIKITKGRFDINSTTLNK